MVMCLSNTRSGMLQDMIERACADLLKSLIEREAAKSESTDGLLLGLQKELSDCEDRLKRLYRSIEDVIVELDDILRERTAALKAQRERAKAVFDHAAPNAAWGPPSMRRRSTLLRG